MPLSKRNPLRKIPRDIKAAYLRSLRRQIAEAKASEDAASNKMLARTASLSDEGESSLSEWESAYRKRRSAQRRIVLVRGKRLGRTR